MSNPTYREHLMAMSGKDALFIDNEIKNRSELDHVKHVICMEHSINESDLNFCDRKEDVYFFKFNNEKAFNEFKYRLDENI